MAIFTTPYDLAKPTVNGADDQDQWGYQWNDNADIINDALVTANYSVVLAKTGNYTATVADQNALITGDVSGGAFSVTLPPAADAGDGFRITVKKIDGSSNTLTIDGNLSETIDGSANYQVTSQNAGATFNSNGVNWYVSGTIAGTTGGAGTLAIEQGGTGATTASGARANLGILDMALQAPSAIAVTGGTMSGVAISGGSITGVSGIPQVTNSANGKIVFGTVTLQWGTGGGGQPVTFGTPFSGTPYIVNYNPVFPTSNATYVLIITSTGFQYGPDGGGTVKWFAIGPT